MPERQESYLEFPTEFPLKAIGAGDDFEAWVLAIVRKHVPDLGERSSTVRASSGGKYLAVTVTFTARSQAQLDALYEELGKGSQVKMLL